jgi:hypothetical protein
VAAETSKKWQGVILEHPEGESLCALGGISGWAPFPSGVEYTERRSPKSLAATPGSHRSNVVNGLGFVLRRC